MYISAKWLGAFVCMCQTGRRVHRDMSNKVVWVLCMKEVLYECVPLSGGACRDMQHIGKQAFVLSASWTRTCHAKQWPTPSKYWDMRPVSMQIEEHDVSDAKRYDNCQSQLKQ